MEINLSFIALVLLSSSAFAQQYEQQLTLSRPLSTGVSSEQKAVQTIIATNQISHGATAVYTAGQSITLQPGFMAQAGSVFRATVEPVLSLPPTSDVPALSAQAYPNPFAEQTTIRYFLPQAGPVHHTLLDARGQVMRQLKESGDQEAGSYQTQVDGASLPAGVYLYRLQVGNQIRTIRLLKKS